MSNLANFIAWANGRPVCAQVREAEGGKFRAWSRNITPGRILGPVGGMPAIKTIEHTECIAATPDEALDALHRVLSQRFKEAAGWALSPFRAQLS
ncbi:hypothetical protein [Niveibacterium sp.]|uniref:hypothetical protein n=1 Tax=Niveibacterium sp. TaxID=2017444 RepID=UPI0035AE9E7F